MPKFETKKLIATLVLIALAVGSYFAAKEYLFEEYELMIKVQRDKFRDPEISKDLVVIGRDYKSYLANSNYIWPRSDTVKILKFLNSAGVERVFYNGYFEKPSNEKDDSELEEVLNTSSAEIFLGIGFHRNDDGKIKIVTSQKRFLKNANEAHLHIGTDSIGQIVAIDYRIEKAGKNVKSIPAQIARVDGKPGEWFPIDYAYDWENVPVFSAIDILRGKIKPSELTGKTVLHGRYHTEFGDSFKEPGAERMPATAVFAIAANMLMQGRPVVVDQATPIILALIFTLLLVWYARPKIGMYLGLVAFPVVFALTTYLESRLIYPEVVPAYLLFLASAGYHRTAIYLDRLDEAARLDLEKSHFLARASHDLRQPIHAIGMLAARLGHTDLSGTQREFVGKIEQSVESASRLFQSLLDLSILESGGLQPEIRPVALDDLFSDLEKQNGIVAEQAGSHFRVIPSQHVIQTDRILLMTVLQNAISNAIKYAPGKDILLGCRHKNGHVAIWVCDRGDGIDESDLSQITEEYFRASDGKVDSIEGAGLGLSIVKRLAKLMGLSVEFRSIKGRGTTVIIGDLEITDEIPETVVPAAETMPQQLSGMRAIVMDDDQDSLKATESILSQWGCEVVGYDRFHRANEECDVIISDFDFGAGQTLADHRDWIKETSQRGISTIVVSGHQKRIVHEAMQQSSLMVLSKPVRPAELRSLLMASKARKMQSLGL